MEIIMYNNQEFKRYRNTIYYVNEYGDVYSSFSNKLLKPYVDCDGYKRIDCYHGNKQKHIKIHKMVYECWVGEISDNKQINHHDDNKNNNHYTNLYSGNQKENIRDCKNNEHRVGNSQLLIVRNKKTNEVLEFQPANKFIEYSGHSQANGSMKRVFSRKWFIDDYKILYFGKGLTTRERASIDANEYRTTEISTVGSALTW